VVGKRQAGEIGAQPVESGRERIRGQGHQLSSDVSGLDCRDDTPGVPTLHGGGNHGGLALNAMAKCL
ncbi:hypothetical protein ABTA35_19705, partial [Acinetobacter baumannii]